MKVRNGSRVIGSDRSLGGHITATVTEVGPEYVLAHSDTGWAYELNRNTLTVLKY